MKNTSALDLNQYVRSVPDFPKPGILFRDITPLLANAAALRETVSRLANPYRTTAVDVVAAAEARGFIFAAPLAIELGKGFVPVRKPGKLPHETRRLCYDLEYGNDALEIHADGLARNERVLLVDDLLATGGTMQACCRLVEECGAQVVGCAFVIELTGLGGAKRLEPYPTFSLLKYE
ncbi:MAG TPA: adenine phosphoribosyltransferase [Pirellulales bacterium]|nr:adenine phosphoribosyltransferase [Pirellulales bacterium]